VPQRQVWRAWLWLGVSRQAKDCDGVEMQGSAGGPRLGRRDWYVGQGKVWLAWPGFASHGQSVRRGSAGKAVSARLE